MLKELVALEERLFSVVAEMEDGRTQVVPVRAERAGDAFRQVKAMPGVRRVGRVAEGRIDAPGGRAGGARDDRSPEAPQQPKRPSLPRDVLIGRVMTGPRVVIDARLSGVERPFAHIPPSDRPMPPAPPVPAVPAVPPPAPKVEAPAPRAETETAAPAEAAAAAAPTAGREYRILKSRRRDGMPYLLQRGAWREGGSGKRVFESEWEKGFATREEAEKHLEWVRRTEQELAQLNHVA